jgi:hypothetical protein
VLCFSCLIVRLWPSSGVVSKKGKIRRARLLYNLVVLLYMNILCCISISVNVYAFLRFLMQVTPFY